MADRRVSRRTMLKSVAAGSAAFGLSKRSSTFAAPAVIQETGSKVKIVYWGSFSAELGEAEQEVVRRFNESQQDVEVEYTFQGTYEETAQKLTAALAGGQPPDVSVLSDVWWFKFYLNNILAPLDDFIAANELDTTDYVDSLFNEGVRGGASFWLPFARSTPLFYYNKDAWLEAGIEDRGPGTWAEFAEWAPALMKRDGDDIVRHAFGHPDDRSYVAWVFQPVVWQHGGSYSDADFTITIAEEQAVAAGDFYRSTVADGWAGYSDDHVRDFNNGLWAAALASTGSMAGIIANNQFENGFGTAFLPEGPEGFGCCTGGAGLSVMAGSTPEKQEAAFKYIAFATSPEITTFWSQTTGYMPVRKSAVESEEMQAYYQENPNFKTAVDQLPMTRPQDAARVFIPNGDQIIGEGLERIIVNEEDVQAVFDDVRATLEEEAEPIVAALAEVEG